MRVHSQDVLSIIDERIKRLQNEEPESIEWKIARARAIRELEEVKRDIGNHIWTPLPEPPEKENEDGMD